MFQKNDTAKNNPTYWRATLTITIVIIIIQATVDFIMGGEAEYFNAYVTLMKLTQWIHGQAPSAPMIYKEAELGMLALPAATSVLVVVPLFIALFIVNIGKLLRSRTSSNLKQEQLS